MMNSAFINNLKIYAPLGKYELLNEIKNKKTILVAINAEKILINNLELKKLINDNTGYPDGVGAVWALKQKGVKTIKIAGAEFWYDIIREFKNQKSFYFIGGNDEVINKTVERIKSEFPDINIKGFRNGFISNLEEQELIEEIKYSKPDIVFVAMGTPRQEFLMDKLLAIHPALYMGLGGSFDIFAGYKKRAPKAFIKFGLEWFYRLAKEPTRYKRQLVYIKFLILLLLRKL